MSWYVRGERTLPLEVACPTIAAETGLGWVWTIGDEGDASDTTLCLPEGRDASDSTISDMLATWCQQETGRSDLAFVPTAPPARTRIPVQLAPIHDPAAVRVRLVGSYAAIALDPD